MSQLYTHLRNFNKPHLSPLDPLEFVIKVRSLSGAPLVTLGNGKKTKSIAFKSKKPTNYYKSNNKPWKPWPVAENCQKCQVRNCSEEKHNNYWLAKQKRSN